MDVGVGIVREILSTEMLSNDNVQKDAVGGSNPGTYLYRRATGAVDQWNGARLVVRR